MIKSWDTWTIIISRNNNDDNYGYLDSEDYNDDSQDIPNTEYEDHPDFDDKNDEL